MAFAHDINPGGNGADRHDPPCDELRFVERRVDSQDQRIANHLAKIDRTVGQMLVAAGEAAENAKHAQHEATRAADSADAIRAVICAPANDMLAKYQSDPPVALRDADEADEPTSVSIRVPHLAERRIRKEQQGRTKAVKQRNWVAIVSGIIAFAAGVIETLVRLGVIH